MDTINVIIPCCNYATHLDLCLMSVFTQRVDCKVDIILSDDNSSDESFGIAQRVALNYNNDKISLRVFKQEKNLGEVENTKFLLSKCTGKYIAYLDADDYWIDPYKLQKQYDFMENNPEYSLCCTGQIIFNGVHHMPDPVAKDNVITPYFFMYNDDELKPHNFVETNFVFSSSRFFRNFDDIVQPYFNDFPYTDWPMNFELSLKGRIKYIHYASYVYRIKDDSLFHAESKKLSLEEQSELRNKRINILKKRLLESNHIH